MIQLNSKSRFPAEAAAGVCSLGLCRARTAECSQQNSGTMAGVVVLMVTDGNCGISVGKNTSEFRRIFRFSFKKQHQHLTNLVPAKRCYWRPGFLLGPKPQGHNHQPSLDILTCAGGRAGGPSWSPEQQQCQPSAPWSRTPCSSHGQRERADGFSGSGC